MFKRIYKHYNLLIDICFWGAAFWLAWLVLGRVFPAAVDVLKPAGGMLRMLLNLNILLAMFLVLARFMRDEYAERIWQQTARRFVNFMMVGPLVLTIVVAVYSKQISAAIPGLMHPRMLEILAREQQPAIVFFAGIAATFLIVAQFVPLLFVVIYKWGLWRDSR